MTSIAVHGWGTDLSVTPIPQDVFEQLQSHDLMDDQLMDIEATYWKERRIWSGFAPDPTLFEILVDGRPLDQEVIDGINVRIAPHQLLPSGICYLISVEIQKGCWVDVQSRKKFRPELLLFDPDTIILPSGDKYSLLSLYFDDKSEFGSTVGKDRNIYVVSANGTKHSLNLLE